METFGTFGTFGTLGTLLQCFFERLSLNIWNMETFGTFGTLEHLEHCCNVSLRDCL